jgi:BTB/POZ domain
MSTMTVPRKAASTNERLANLLFDHPGADIILRSQDSYHFRVPKIYIIGCSPILGEVIRRTLHDANTEVSLPAVQLPESGEILHCLLTFIFPITQLVPPTPEKIMELLSVAQKYQMETVLAHIRGSIARQNSLPTRLESVLHIYALAQKYGLRQEALQTARAIFSKQSMAIEDFENNLDIMPGTSLYELWKYHERVRAILASDLTEFRASYAGGTITGLRCTALGPLQIPSWLDHYIESIGENPSLFDSTELSIVMARHVKGNADDSNCECASIPSYIMRKFWEALASVVDGGFDKVSYVDMPSCLAC